MPDTKNKNGDYGVKNDTVRDNTQGININATTNKSNPAKHEVKLVKYGKGTSAKSKIIGTDGTVIYDGRDSDEATQEAIRKVKNKVGDTLLRRKKNSDYYNNSNPSSRVVEEKKTMIRMPKRLLSDSELEMARKKRT